MRCTRGLEGAGGGAAGAGLAFFTGVADVLFGLRSVVSDVGLVDFLAEHEDEFTGGGELLDLGAAAAFGSDRGRGGGGAAGEAGGVGGERGLIGVAELPDEFDCVGASVATGDGGIKRLWVGGPDAGEFGEGGFDAARPPGGGVVGDRGGGLALEGEGEGATGCVDSDGLALVGGKVGDVEVAGGFVDGDAVGAGEGGGSGPEKEAEGVRAEGVVKA